LIVEKNSEGVAVFDFGTRNTGFEQAKYFRGSAIQVWKGGYASSKKVSLANSKTLLKKRGLEIGRIAHARSDHPARPRRHDCFARCFGSGVFGPVVAESVLVKHQLLILSCSRRRAIDQRTYGRQTVEVKFPRPNLRQGGIPDKRI